jgi:hypothetical protein
MNSGEERWKDIDGWEDWYSVSSQGRVMSHSRPSPSKGGSTRILKARILKLKMDEDGYLRVGLSRDGHETLFSVHRLVALAFVPNNENKPEVNHVDNNPSNNNESNLEWCTHKENVDHCRNQARGYVLPAQKELDSTKKQQISEMLERGLSRREVCRQLNVSKDTIRKYFGASPRR